MHNTLSKYKATELNKKVKIINGMEIFMTYVLKIEKGRDLSQDEEVHHKNKNRLDSTIFNLEIVNKTDHKVIHEPDRCFWKELRTLKTSVNKLQGDLPFDDSFLEGL